MPKQDVSEGEHFDVSEDEKNEFAIPLTEDGSSSSMMETNRAALFASRFLLFDRNCVGILTFIGQILFFLCFICLYSLILGIDGVDKPLLDLSDLYYCPTGYLCMKDHKFPRPYIGCMSMEYNCGNITDCIAFIDDLPYSNYPTELSLNLTFSRSQLILFSCVVCIVSFAMLGYVFFTHRILPVPRKSTIIIDSDLNSAVTTITYLDITYEVFFIITCCCAGVVLFVSLLVLLTLCLFAFYPENKPT